MKKCNLISELLNEYTEQKITKLKLSEEISNSLLADTAAKLQTIGSRMDNRAITPMKTLIADTIKTTKVILRLIRDI